MENKSQGILINLAGGGNYQNPDAVEKVIRYITRTNGQAMEDMIAWGGLGVTEFAGVDTVIKQFCYVQGEYYRKGEFGRYMDHEVFSMSAEMEARILEEHIDLDGIAREMARDIYKRDHCQVVYGIHKSDKGNGHMHIHFGVNTVDFRTLRKRRENKRGTKEREARFQRIVEEGIRRHSERQ